MRVLYAVIWSVAFAILILSCNRSDDPVVSSGIDHERLANEYQKYRESSLDQRRIKHAQILSLINELEQHEQLTVSEAGRSIGDKSIKLISFGEGPTDVLLWSQMHGNESTATMAIFDILNLLTSDGAMSEYVREQLSGLTLHFIPMLNPDGADRWQRRNTLGIDINRDALRLQSPEGRTLKRVRDSLNPAFGFNLHDQSRYYNTGLKALPATISILAPAYNHAKDINEVRGNAMKVIGVMNNVLQQYIPGQVGKYDDTFEPRAFGDNIQKWGTSAILIESGGYRDDREKQEIRKLNFIGILSALSAISQRSYTNVDLEEYHNIPQNNRRLYDLVIRRAYYELEGMRYTIDLAINHNEIDFRGNSDFYFRSIIADQGDLSINFGYNEMDASGYTVRMGKVYPRIMKNMEEVEKLDISDMLRKGYTYVRVRDRRGAENYTSLPLQVVGTGYTPPPRIVPYIIPNLILEKSGNVEYAIVNGFVFNPNSDDEFHGNGLVFK